MKSIDQQIKGNPYVGRGIIVGKSEDGKNAVIAYFIMGRSENSRNRKFSTTEDTVYTEAADITKVKDPSLIMYTALRRFNDYTVVTNGDQTDTVYETVKAGGTFEQALDTRCFEPDAPNYTPRISAILKFADKDFKYKISILKSGDDKGETCTRECFSYEPINGVGHLIHTYVTDGNPLPSYQGEPACISIPNDMKQFADTVWDSLDSENKISLYVSYTDLDTNDTKQTIINKN